ncbi:MAG TPA: hypothetical protein VGC30_03725, partial [Dokdonella sp.]
MAAHAVRWTWSALAAAALVAAGVAGCRSAPDPNAPIRLTADVSVTGPVTPDRIEALKSAGFRTVVNLR